MEYRIYDWTEELDQYSRHQEFPCFEAFSYAWGAQEAIDTVTVVGVDENRDCYLRVRPNVLQMLRHLRGTDRRRLWIDALCINQSDVFEKELQVALMGEIYSAAEQVLIWIGTEDDEIVWVRGPNPRTTFDYTEHLLGRAWFHRRWTIQEVVKSRKATVICGNDTLAFEDFVTRATSLEQARLTVKQSEALVRLRNIVLLRNSTTRSYFERPIMQLMVDFHAAQCSDGRDRSYALLGLSTSPSP